MMVSIVEVGGVVVVVSDVVMTSLGMVVGAAVVVSIWTAVVCTVVTVVCGDVSVTLSFVVVSAIVRVLLIGVVSAFGADERLPVVVAAPLISKVLRVSAFGFNVVVVSSLVGDVLVSVAGVLSATIADVEVSPELAGPMVDVAALVSFDVLFVSGESVGS